MPNQIKNSNQERELKGFTLIELLIVIAIIGTLAGILFVSIGQGPLKKARAARAAATLNELNKVLILYLDANQFYPCFDHDWNDARENSWSAPYISSWPKNPWNTEYHWEHSQQGLTFSISMRDVPTDEAQMLDKAMDDNNSSTGIIRFGGNPARVEYGGVDQAVSFVNCH